MVSSRAFKEDKYKNLNSLKSQQFKNTKFTLITCEITTLGFMRFDSSTLLPYGIKQLDENLIITVAKEVIQSTFDIYVRRNTDQI